MEASGIELMTFPTGVGTLFDSEQKKNHSVFSEWFLKLVEVNGVEPMTSCLQGRRSSQLSYTPILKKIADSCFNKISTIK